MRILILQDEFPPHQTGGAAIVAFALAKKYKESGHEVLVVTTVQERHFVGREIVEGLEVVKLYTSYNVRWRAYRSLYNSHISASLKKIIAEWKPEVVHAHNVHMHLSYHSLKIAASKGAKVFLTAHDAMLFHYDKTLDTKKVRFFELMRVYGLRFNPLRNFFIRRYMSYVMRIVAVSDALKEALINNGFANIQTIHNGIDVNQWAKPEGVDAYKKELGVGEHAVLFGGRLSNPKGGMKVLDALALIIKKVPNAQLLIIGKKDEYGQKMLAYANELGVGDHVIFTGWLTGEDLRRTYYAASVIAVPSLYLDPFPTINLEAMACSKPVVATCLGGSKEVVEDGITGYVVDPFDTAALAASLVKLLQDKEINRRFGDAGLERIAKDFSLEKQVEKYERLFTAVQ